jgi:hypothetical protein
MIGRRVFLKLFAGGASLEFNGRLNYCNFDQSTRRGQYRIIGPACF